MQLDARQQDAVRAVMERLGGPRNPVVVTGAAGTGKSEIIREAARIDPETVVLAPTNRACRRLRKSGVPAMTIHSCVYQSTAFRLRDQLAGAQMAHKSCSDRIDALTAAEASEKELLEQRAIRNVLDARIEELKVEIDKARASGRGDEELKLSWRFPNGVTGRHVVVDEASMVGGKLLNDIAASEPRSLALVGDPYQLPPVKDEDVFGKAVPTVELTKVHRHAGAILDVATLVRNGLMRQAFDLAKSEGIVRHGSNAGPPSEAADAVELCWTNRVRRIRNLVARAAAGRSGEVEPQAGDKIVARRRSSCVSRDPERGRQRDPVFNATFATVTGRRSECRCKLEPDRYKRLQLVGEGCAEVELDDGSEAWICLGDRMWDEDESERDWTWAYTVTAHKSQGGEWPNVVVIDERPTDAKRWMYTALTRARDKVTWVRHVTKDMLDAPEEPRRQRELVLDVA